MVRRGGTGAQRKNYELDRGLYLVRYDVAADPAQPAVIDVSHAGRKGARDVEIIAEPDAKGTQLVRPGDALVIRADEPVTIRIEVTASVAGGSTEASVRLEQLRSSAAPSIDPEQDDAAIEAIGHLAMRGDVTVLSGEWLGGPEQPTRIEGLVLRQATRSTGGRLTYAVKVAGRTAQVIGPVAEGEFAGTKGRALGLSEVSIELDGPESDEIIVDALFRGATGGSVPVSARGSRVAVSGPTGREILVGLKLSIASTPVRAGQSVETQPSSRVRVFRGRDHQRPASGRSR